MASAGWADERTFVLRMCLTESPFMRTVTCRFERAGLIVEARDNVGFGPTEFPPVRLRPAGPAGR